MRRNPIDINANSQEKEKNTSESKYTALFIVNGQDDWNGRQ